MQTMRRLLRDFVNMCAPLEVVPILMHGALVGWYQFRELLPWDDDIDLCLGCRDLAKLDRARDLSYQRDRHLFEINPNYVSRQTLNRTFRDMAEPNKIDARFIDKATGLFIDITALSPTGPDRVSTKCPHTYRTDDLYPLQPVEFEGATIHVPRRVEAVLEQEYGRWALKGRFPGYWTLKSLRYRRRLRPGGRRRQRRRAQTADYLAT
jgi:phosphorylcholine metabolism protein LicD